MEAVDFKNAMIERHGEEIYKKISSSSVAIAGLGGLGSNIAISLARCGVGKLLLVDFDRVDISNINRQQYFYEQIGIKKTKALSEIIKKINPYINIETKCIKVTEENAQEIFDGYKIVCEAFDDAQNKAMLVNALLEKTDAYIVAASGMAGYSSSNSIQTKKAMERLYLCGDFVTDIKDANGLMAPRVAICANHQANMVIRLICDEYDV